MTARRMVRTLVLAGLAAGVLGSAAQAQPRGWRGPRAAATAPEGYAGPYNRGRGDATYAVSPRFGGTITASTPNESGNLGGPSTGGGGGGGR